MRLGTFIYFSASLTITLGATETFGTTDSVYKHNYYSSFDSLSRVESLLEHTVSNSRLPDCLVLENFPFSNEDLVNCACTTPFCPPTNTQNDAQVMVYNTQTDPTNSEVYSAAIRLLCHIADMTFNQHLVTVLAYSRRHQMYLYMYMGRNLNNAHTAGILQTIAQSVSEYGSTDTTYAQAIMDNDKDSTFGLVITTSTNYHQIRDANDKWSRGEFWFPEIHGQRIATILGTFCLIPDKDAKYGVCDTTLHNPHMELLPSYCGTGDELKREYEQSLLGAIDFAMNRVPDSYDNQI